MKNFTLVKGKIIKATFDSAAFDLLYNGESEIRLEPGQTLALPTGVFTEFSPGLVCIIKEKSGLALKGLEVHGGVIDADYRDEWKVVVRNGDEKNLFTSEEDVIVLKPGQAIAQFLIIKLPKVNLFATGDAEIAYKDQKRTGGFGSTGV